MKTPIAAALAVLMMLVSSPAAAASDEDKAFEHFDVGAQLYFDGDFAGALQEFNAGFALFPHPMFQVNIAVSHWRLGDLERAIVATDLAAVLQDQLEPDVAAENLARRATFAAILSTQGAADRFAKVNAEADLQAAGDPTPEPEPVAGRPLLSPLGWAGAGTGVVGVGLLVAWSVAEVGLQGEVDALEAAGRSGNRAAYDAASDELQSKQSTARILLASGVGLAVVGVGLVGFDLLRPSGDQQARLRLHTTGRAFTLQLDF